MQQRKGKPLSANSPFMSSLVPGKLLGQKYNQHLPAGSEAGACRGEQDTGLTGCTPS